MYAWSDIEGQDRAKELLQRSLERGRLHHGHLFVGPLGVGKRSTALAFAKLLNCTARPDAEFRASCGHCPSCRKYDNDLQHPDLHLIAPEGGVNKTIKIAQVRELQKVAARRPYEGRWQVVIIDDAHAMTDEAANALLKTLEEPSDAMRLILVTDQPHALLDTIRSRCQTLRFGALEPELVVKILRRDVPDTDDALCDVASRYGEGSVGRARALLESGLLDERASLLDTLTALDRAAPAQLLDLAAPLGKERGKLLMRLEILSVLLRDVLMVQVGVGRERLVNADLEPGIVQLAERMRDGLLPRIDAVAIARDLVTRNVNGTLIIENLFTELAPGTPRPAVLLPKF